MIEPKKVPCRKCGAPIGVRCLPRSVMIGWHLERLLDAGGCKNVR